MSSTDTNTARESHEEALGTINGLRLRSGGSTARTTAVSQLRRALGVIVTDNERLKRQLADEQKARQFAQVTSSNTHHMVGVVADLTRLFPDVEWDFVQGEENDGYHFEVVGSDKLSVNVNYYYCSVRVGRPTNGRKSRTYGLEIQGLSTDAFLAIEAMFDEVTLTRANTPRRLHDELFEDPNLESNQDSDVIGVMVGPDCGYSDCPLHGKGGLAETFSTLGVFGRPSARTGSLGDLFGRL